MSDTNATYPEYGVIKRDGQKVTILMAPKSSDKRDRVCIVTHNIQRLIFAAKRHAATDLANPFAYATAYSLMMGGIASPEDY